MSSDALGRGERDAFVDELSSVDVAAIDAPIVPRGDLSVHRVCERALTLGAFQKRCKPGASHVPGSGRLLRKEGMHVAGRLATRTRTAVVEAFPNAFLAVAVAEPAAAGRRKKAEVYFEQWRTAGTFAALARLLDLPATVVQECLTADNRETRAAVVCLLTAACVHRRRFVEIGDPAGGFIVLPPFELWADWARRQLDDSCRRTEGVEVHAGV